MGHSDWFSFVVPAAIVAGWIYQAGVVRQELRDLGSRVTRLEALLTPVPKIKVLRGGA